MQGSGISSESIWTPFNSITTAAVREPVATLGIAWTRISTAGGFFTIGTSTVGGTDTIKGLGVSAITGPDAFEFFDETENVIRLEYERHLIEPLGGTSIALADIVLNNTDLRFTPEYNSTIGTALRPQRPMRIFIGFKVRGQETTIPIIKGVTVEDPREDKSRRTVKLRCVDYVRWLNEQPQETAIFTDQRSDQIIESLLSSAGVGSDNYQLDTGNNTIGFAWFEKGSTAGERIRKICEAEEAIFYQDEAGILRFENRDKYSASPYNASVWDIEPDDIIRWEHDRTSKIINRVLVIGRPRTVQAEEEVWRAGEELVVPASGSLTVWANFEDPVSSFTSPVQDTDFKAFSVTGGGGSDISSDVSFAITSFTTSVKMIITNANAGIAYMNFVRLRGTPVTVNNTIKEVFWDTDSINDYNEHQVTIENEFIDNATWAASLAQKLVQRHKRPNQVLRLTVRGIPQLQLRDQVRVKDQDLATYTNYRVIAIRGIFESGGFTQTLNLRKITALEAN